MLCLADRSFFGFEVTAILDYEQAPAAELAALYPERREIETALDELKTHLRGGAHVVLRSKTPDLVRQDFWGMVPAHFAVRGLMHEAVLAANEDPDRLSFTHAVRVICRQLPQLAASPPRRWRAYHDALPWEILEERVVSSRGRRIARGVKRKLSNYQIRPPGTTRSQPADTKLHILSR
jgi:hypothetical protein